MAKSTIMQLLPRISVLHRYGIIDGQQKRKLSNLLRYSCKNDEFLQKFHEEVGALYDRAKTERDRSEIKYVLHMLDESNI